MVKIIKETKPEELKHHFVFLEKLSKTGAVEYGSGEYLVISSSPNALYVTKPKVGYDFANHYDQAKNIVGTEPWSVVSAFYDREKLLQLARENYIWGVRGGGQWISSVYEQARANAESILRELNEPFPSIEESSDPEKTIVAGKAQVILSKRMRALVKATGCQAENVQRIVERIFFELGQ